MGIGHHFPRPFSGFSHDFGRSSGHGASRSEASRGQEETEEEAKQELSLAERASLQVPFPEPGRICRDLGGIALHLNDLVTGFIDIFYRQNQHFKEVKTYTG